MGEPHGHEPKSKFRASEQHLEWGSEQLVTNFIHIRWTNGGSLMPDPVEVVRQFCALMEKRDPEELRPFLASGAVYQNVGMPAFTGVEAILENMGASFRCFRMPTRLRSEHRQRRLCGSDRTA